MNEFISVEKVKCPGVSETRNFMTRLPVEGPPRLPTLDAIVQTCKDGATRVLCPGIDRAGLFCKVSSDSLQKPRCPYTAS